LEGKRIQDHPQAPGADVKWYRQRLSEGTVKEKVFPGAEIRKVDMTRYNERINRADEYRQLHFYCIVGNAGPDLNLHACAHLYASDRNSMYLIPNAVKEWGQPGMVSMSSLSHTVVFHTGGEGLRWKEEEEEEEHGEKGYFCQEAWTSRSGGNRAVHESRIWSREGLLVATTLQDGVVRVVMDPKKDRSRM
jgi:acyl-CoA thioesterase